MKKLIVKCLSICLLNICFTYQSNAQELITTPVDATDADMLVNLLLGDNVNFSNAVLITDNIGTNTSLSRAAGFFEKGNTTNIGLDAGVLLTTGSVNYAVGPNLSTGQGVPTSNNGAPGDPAISNSNDATVLQFNFIPHGEHFSFRYVFASEEYPEFVCDEFNGASTFNDAFRFLLTGSNPNGSNYDAENIALLPGGEVVSINNVNDDECGEDNVEFYVSNPEGDNTTIQYDGFTTVLTAQADVVPCQTYTIRLVIADRYDYHFDSAVFLEGGSFTATGMAPLDVDFTFRDDAGDAQSQFCFGESVILDATASDESERWYIEIREYNIGGSAANEIPLRSCITEISTDPLETLDMEEVWASCTGVDNEPNELMPGFEYVVTLALADACGNEGKQTQMFSVICCESEEFCTADFYLKDLGVMDSTISFFTVNIDASTNPWSQSNWFLFTHEEPGEGPYTPVASVSNSGLEFETNFGTCYTLVHQVVSDCGVCCFFQEVCIDTSGETTVSEPDGMEGINCEDLDIGFCSLTKITGLDCESDEEAVTLTWDAVPNVESYLVDVFVNDPACCKFQGGGIPFPGTGDGTQYEVQYETTTNSILTEIKDGSCFSWQVTAICKENNTTTSDRICTSGFCKLAGGGDIGDIIINPLMQFDGDQIEVYPNPSSAVVNFSVNMMKTSSTASVNIYDTNYRLVETITDFNHSGNLIAGKWQIDSRINNGIYFLEIVLDHAIMTEKILVAK